jgi:hypothetical protein
MRRFGLKMIILIVMLASISTFAVLMRWIFPPEKAVEKIQSQLTPKVISAIQKGLETIESQKPVSVEPSSKEELPKLEGISKALLGRSNPFEPLSELPKPQLPFIEEKSPETSSALPSRSSGSSRTRTTASKPRRKTQPSSEGEKETKPPPKVELKGIVYGMPNVAIIEVDGTTKVVSEGEAVGDMRVASIDEDQVVLTYNGGRIRLRMKEIIIGGR